MVKIACKISGLNISSNFPRFKYSFGKSGETLEINEKHAEKILRNSSFYLSDVPVKKDKKTPQNKPKKEKPWVLELEEIKGIGEKRAEDIVAVYPTKGSLLEAISSKAKIPFRDDVVEKLKEALIH